MPDFGIRFAAGTTLAVWEDHETTRPSRINPAQARPQRYVKATVGVEVVVQVSIGDVINPNDDELPDPALLFSSDFAEYPTTAAPVATSPPGRTGEQHFTPTAPGHYLWILRHANGGAVGLHLDAEP